MIKEFIKKITTVIDQKGQERTIALALVPFVFLGNFLAACSNVIHNRKDIVNLALISFLTIAVAIGVIHSFIFEGNQMSIHISIAIGSALLIACILTFHFALNEVLNNNKKEDI